MARFALRNLLTRPVRSLLALTGLSIAIVGMVGLFSLTAGIRSLVQSTFREVQGIAVLEAGAPLPLFSKLPVAMESRLREIPGVAFVVPELWHRANLIDGKPVLVPPTLLFGVGTQQPNLEPDGTLPEPSVYRKRVVEGRFLRPQDKEKNHALISRAIAERYKKKKGDQIVVGNTPLRIVGIYEAQNYVLDQVILLDLDLARKMSGMDAQSVTNYFVKPTDPSRMEELIAAIETRFNKESPEKSVEPDSRAFPPVDARSTSEWGNLFSQLGANLDVFLYMITALAMVIGVVGIVNTMLMSVMERFVEFGILKANGWSRGDIMRLVTLESLFLGVASGFVGTLVGWVLARVASQAFPISLVTPVQLLGLAVALAVALGVLGGLYPARRAARLLPMDAIRGGMT